MRYGYMRVSTDDQFHDLQKNALIAAGVTPENIFSDTISGNLQTRPSLNRLLDLMVEGDELVVWKLDRLGRNLGHLIFLVEALAKKGQHFVSLTENLDTTTPAGRCMFHVIGAFAQMEREMISQRTKEGIKAAQAKGIKVGRKRAPYRKHKQVVALLQDPKVSMREAARITKMSLGFVQRTVNREIAEGRMIERFGKSRIFKTNMNGKDGKATPLREITLPNPAQDFI